MADLTGFDATQEEEMKDFSLLPEGDYEVMITESEMKETKKGDGQFLTLTMQVNEPGELAGRFIWVNLNLDNPNEVSVKISRAELAAICRAVDVIQPDDSEDLHNIPFVVTLKHKMSKFKGELEAIVKKYAPAGIAQAAAPAKKPMTAKKAPAAAKKAAPWKK